MGFFKTEKAWLRGDTEDPLSSAVGAYLQSIGQGDYNPQLPEVDVNGK